MVNGLRRAVIVLVLTVRRSAPCFAPAATVTTLAGTVAAAVLSPRRRGRGSAAARIPCRPESHPVPGFEGYPPVNASLVSALPRRALGNPVGRPV